MNDIPDTTLAPDGLCFDDNKITWYPARGSIKPATLKFPPDENIEVWLTHNAPLTLQQLADIRYSLYHHCSRANFIVANVIGDGFDLTGRHSKLRVVSNNARRYLLWRLRALGKTKSWIGAIPRTRKPGNK